MHLHLQCRLCVSFDFVNGIIALTFYVSTRTGANSRREFQQHTAQCDCEMFLAIAAAFGWLNQCKFFKLLLQLNLVGLVALIAAHTIDVTWSIAAQIVRSMVDVAKHAMIQLLPMFVRNRRNWPEFAMRHFPCTIRVQRADFTKKANHFRYDGMKVFDLSWLTFISSVINRENANSTADTNSFIGRQSKHRRHRTILPFYSKKRIKLLFMKCSI